MKTKFGVWLHISVVLLVILLDPPSMGRLTSSFGEFSEYVLTRIFPLVMFYICFLWLVPSWLSRRKIAMFALLLFIMANLLTLAGYSILQGVHIAYNPADGFHYNAGMHMSGLRVLIFSGVFGTMYRLAFDMFALQDAKSGK